MCRVLSEIPSPPFLIPRRKRRRRKCNFGVAAVVVRGFPMACGWVGVLWRQRRRRIRLPIVQTILASIMKTYVLLLAAMAMAAGDAATGSISFPIGFRMSLSRSLSLKQIGHVSWSWSWSYPLRRAARGVLIPFNTIIRRWWGQHCGCCRAKLLTHSGRCCLLLLRQRGRAPPAPLA